MNLTKETAVTGIRKNKQGQVVAFNINRKVWGRGERGGSLLEVGTLEDSEGNEISEQINMCCLGVYGRACGISANRLKGNGMPQNVAKLPKQMNWTVNKSGTDSSNTANKLAGINDRTGTTDASKERRIKARFAKQGIKVRFVGKG